MCNFFDIKIKKGVAVPYISKSKCTEYLDVYEDNGRVMSAKSLRMCITEIDLKIILSQYEMNSDYNLKDFRIARKGELPEVLKEVIRIYYNLKTEKKDLPDELDKIIYMKSKNKLNSIYGNSAQNPGKIGILYRNGTYIPGYYNRKTEEEITFTRTDDIDADKNEINKLIRTTYNNSSTVLPFQFGVYTTALARYELQKMIDICGDNFLYCDTDAVYFVYSKSIIKKFEEYNKEKIALSTKNHAYATDTHGVIHYMGVAECEHDDIISFKTLGAKKYAYITEDGNLHITTSGVNKKLAVPEILVNWWYSDKESPLDLYTPGFEFSYAGGNEIEYIDTSTGYLNIHGHPLYVGTCAIIRPSTYTLSLTDDYTFTINNPKLLRLGEFWYDIENNITIDINELYS